MPVGNRLWLLECKFDRAEERFATGTLAGGCHDAQRDIAAACQLHRVRGVWRHEVIRVAIAQLGFEAREKLFLAAIPGDDDLRACELPAV